MNKVVLVLIMLIVSSLFAGPAYNNKFIYPYYQKLFYDTDTNDGTINQASCNEYGSIFVLLGATPANAAPVFSTSEQYMPNQVLVYDEVTSGNPLRQAACDQYGNLYVQVTGETSILDLNVVGDVQVTGSVTITATCEALTFVGDGSNLTGISSMDTSGVETIIDDYSYNSTEIYTQHETDLTIEAYTYSKNTIDISIESFVYSSNEIDITIESVSSITPTGGTLEINGNNYITGGVVIGATVEAVGLNVARIEGNANSIEIKSTSSVGFGVADPLTLYANCENSDYSNSFDSRSLLWQVNRSARYALGIENIDTTDGQGLYIYTKNADSSTRQFVFINSSGVTMDLRNNGQLYINASAGSPELTVSGTISCTQLIESSGIANKENIVDVEAGSLSKVVQMQGKKYDLKEKKVQESWTQDDEGNPVYYDRTIVPELKGQLGFIAEDMASICPEAVVEIDGEKYINYRALLPIFAEAIQELEERVSALEPK